jgi:multiple sugar transport system substrate-binding protein
MSTYSDRKDEALMFIAYLCSYTIQRNLILDLGWQPGRRDVYFDSKVLQRRPYYRQIAQIFGSKMMRPYIGTHPYIPNVVRKSFENAIAGRTSAWEALNSVQLRFMEFYQ